MKESFLRHLDTHGGEWTVDVFEENGDEIVTGILSDKSGTAYPIIAGIPRLLEGAWLDRCLVQHEEFAVKYGVRFPRNSANFSETVTINDALQLRTQSNYSYQWTYFNKMLPIYEENHRLYFQPHGKEFFAGRLGLDAGCGTGRHVYYAAKYGAEIIGVDLSDAVETAYRNTLSLKNVHIAQADLYNLPFRQDYFDFVESVGVIHILPDPKSALGSLVKLIRPGGDAYIYVYPSSSIERKNNADVVKLYFKDLYETIGRTLPLRLLNGYCFLAALIGRTWNVPLRVLQRWSVSKRLATKLIAFKTYEMYPFYVLHTDLFDWIGTPLNRYLSFEEVCDLYAGGPFDKVEIRPEAPHWRVFAKKATTPGSEFAFEKEKAMAEGKYLESQRVCQK